MAEIYSNFQAQTRQLQTGSSSLLKLWHLLPQEDSTLEEITWISIADSSLGLCPKMKNPFILFGESHTLKNANLATWTSV